MDLPNASDLLKKAEEMAGGTAGDMAKDKVTDISAPEIAKLEALADSVGLGSLVENAVNAVEEKVGMDLDGDKDIAK